MAKQVPWNSVILDEFISLALLTEDEEKIMRTRIAGWTRTKQAMEFGMSLSSIDRIISTLKHKYDDVQRYSDILPPRKHSVCELYMDEH